MPPKQETFYTITAARASDLEHFFAGSIAVGAGEQSRSRRREPGRGDGRDAGCEKRAVDEQVRGCAECARTQGDREHLSAGSIAVGAGEQSRSRRREPGCGDGREAGCEKRAADERARGCAECARTRGRSGALFRGEYRGGSGVAIAKPAEGVRRRVRGSWQRTRGRKCGRGTERKKRVADEQARGYAGGARQRRETGTFGGGSG